jgi:putative endopeptidase
MLRTIPRSLLILLTALFLASSAAQTAVATRLLQVAPTDIGKPGIDLAGMDRSVDPGEDFYTYANGTWMEDTELPAGYPSFGSFDEAGNRSNEVLVEILFGLDPDDDSDAGKARTLFDMMVDTDTRDEQGIEPISDLLDEIMAISSIEDGLVFQQKADTLQLLGLFAPYAAPSPADATQAVAWLYGPQLSLPSADYYLNDSAESEEVREAWVDATTSLLRELGYSRREASQAAELILQFETELARIKTPDAVLQNDQSVSATPYTLDELAEMLPGFDWQAFVAETDLPDDVDSLYVRDIEYLQNLAEVLDEADPLILQYLFATQLAWAVSDYLTTDMFEIADGFNSLLSGVDSEPDVLSTAFFATLSSFPDVFGQEYVERAFSPEAKAEIEALVDHLIDAFRLRIENNEWMSEETKAKAIEKLDLMTVLVGYPDEWTTYEDVIIGDSVYETMQNIYTLTNTRTLGEVGGPIDRSEWPMSAFEINASYIPTQNAIVFPAGVLQSPFFDPTADLAFNYGGIGAVIGHEITHAFDISGSQYDGYGNLVEWWTPEDYDAFSALNAQVIAQYDEIEVLPDLFVNGELTITENVADMGGVQVAYDGLVMALDDAGTPITASDQQRFFIAWAQVWRRITTPEFTRLLVTTDEHAPGDVRAVQPLRNMDQFFETFDITRTDDEYLPPEERVVIW